MNLSKITTTDRTGSCGAYQCRCSSYAPGRTVGGWSACDCGHTMQVHNPAGAR